MAPDEFKNLGLEFSKEGAANDSRPSTTSAGPAQSEGKMNR
jgi:hypothetical protein